MSDAVKRSRSLVLALVLATVGTVGGAVVATLAFPASAVGAHPCQEDECDPGQCPWWNPGCTPNDECVPNDGEETYCDMSGGGDEPVECTTKACQHN